jgi:general stress protein 26
MKVESQQSTAMQELADSLEDQRTAMLTLVEAGGHLGARPLTALEMDGQGSIWFMVSRRSMAAVAARPGTAVNLAFSDSDKSLYVSMAGTALLVDDAARKESLWTGMARPWFSGADDPALSLLCVKPSAIEVWDGPDSSVVRALAMAASVAAGQPVGLGEHKDIKPATSA